MPRRMTRYQVLQMGEFNRPPRYTYSLDWLQQKNRDQSHSPSRLWATCRRVIDWAFGWSYSRPG